MKTTYLIATAAMTLFATSAPLQASGAKLRIIRELLKPTTANAPRLNDTLYKPNGEPVQPKPKPTPSPSKTP